MSLLSLYQQNSIKNDDYFLAKNVKGQCIVMKIEQKVRIKMRNMSIDIFSSQTL